MYRFSASSLRWSVESCRVEASLPHPTGSTAGRQSKCASPKDPDRAGVGAGVQSIRSVSRWFTHLEKEYYTPQDCWRCGNRTLKFLSPGRQLKGSQIHVLTPGDPNSATLRPSWLNGSTEIPKRGLSTAFSFRPRDLLNKQACSPLKMSGILKWHIHLKYRVG